MVICIGELGNLKVSGFSLFSLVDTGIKIDEMPAGRTRRFHEYLDVILAVGATGVADIAVVINDGVDIGRLRPAFATHGLVPGDLNGLTQPALALSAPEVTHDPNNDGLLTMGEILGLKLNADWVVLSACNTGSGSGAGAEAVSGLGRAFFYAGTLFSMPVHAPFWSAIGPSRQPVPRL